MTRETDYLIQSLFEKESLEEMTLDEFRSISEQYPYSSIVQFLYSCKLKSVYHLDFPEQVTHTALFFPSPQWLNYQLSDESEIGNFRLIQYDINFNNVSEDVPVEIDQSNENTWEYDEEQSNFSSTENEMASVENKEEITQHQPLILKENNPVETLQIPIEPYHTVDYFASQGIKTLLDNQNDDLGKKVRSFTAWLKTMKSLQPVQGNDSIEDDDEARQEEESGDEDDEHDENQKKRKTSGKTGPKILYAKIDYQFIDLKEAQKFIEDMYFEDYPAFIYQRY